MSSFVQHLISSGARRLSPALQRLRRDERGIAAVEFAMILPIMFFLFVGTIEFSQALSVDRRVTQSASTSADLIARTPDGNTTTAQVDSELLIVAQLMKPFDVTPLTVRITNVVAAVDSSTSTTRYLVNWSRDNHGATPYVRGSDFANMPTDLLSNNESAIVAEASYVYTPMIFSYFIKEAFSLQERFYLKPRGGGVCVRLDGQSCIGI